jgi:ribosomal protein L23
MATESEMKEAAAFAFNVDVSQVTISDAKQQDVKTNFWRHHQTSHRCYVTKAAEPKLRTDPAGRR